MHAGYLSVAEHRASLNACWVFIGNSTHRAAKCIPWRWKIKVVASR